MSKPFLGAVLVAIVSIGCGAQSSPAGAPQPVPAKEQQTKQLSSTLHLTPVETITAPSEVAAGFAQLGCDSDGNLYLGSDSPAPGVRKLNTKGELVALFQPDANPDVKVWGSGSFAVTLDGELYNWVGAKTEITRYVLVFKPDGTYKSAIKLQPGFPWIPASLAVFANGTLLITGQEYDVDRSKPMLPFTAIFSADGRLLKEVSLEDDERLHGMAVAHDPHVSSSMNPTGNRAVSWGQMEAAKDGNIYVMRWQSPAIIYAVSPGGAVVRRFTVDPGRDDLMPVKMHIAGNRMAILFTQRQTNEKIMRVVDLEGQELATYDELREQGKPKLGTLGSAFACYTVKPERFTFLVTTDDHRIQLKQVEGR